MSSWLQVRLLSTEIVIERNLYINKDNQVLLNKLVEISHGKWVSLLILTLLCLVLSQSTEEKYDRAIVCAKISKHHSAKAIEWKDWKRKLSFC